MIILKLFDDGLGPNMRKVARHLGGIVSSKVHVAGGASSSITMVVVFVVCLCCCGWTRDVTRPLYVKFGTKITFR
jgi:hypothetical protein